jgi:TPR repeat protein
MKLRAITKACVCVIFVFCTFAQASELEDGLQAFEHKEYAKAFQLILHAAESGDVHAQLAISGMYKKGLGTPVNYKESYKWLKRYLRHIKKNEHKLAVLSLNQRD